MATKTVSIGDDVTAALNFLGKQQKPEMTGEEFFQSRLQIVIDDVLKSADEQRFALVSKLLNDKAKGESISKIRELLG